MNKFFKLFPALIISLLVSTAVSANIPAPAVQIYNYANGGKYFVKSRQRIPITPVGCKQTEPISITLRSYETADGQNPEANTYSPSTPTFVYTNHRAIIGSDTIFTTSELQGIDEAATNSYFKSYEYTLTCTPAAGGTEVSRTVTFVVSRGDSFIPMLDGNAPVYERCNNPLTNEGIRVRMLIGRTLDNPVEWKFETDASYQPLSITDPGLTYQYNFYRQDYQVLDGNYYFRYKFLDYFDGTSIVPGEGSNNNRVALQRKVGSPLLDKNNFIANGIVLVVNDNNSQSGLTDVCATDKVALRWLDWDKYFSNAAFRNNWSFQWQKENQGGYVPIGGDRNDFVVESKDFAPNYRIKFIPKGNSVGCENDPLSAGEYMNSTFLSATVKPVKTPVIIGDSKVCPDGSIDLTIDKSATTTNITWTNLASNTSLVADKYTVTSAGSYTVKYQDSGIKNSFGEVCTSPIVTQVVTSYNKPVAPTVVSSDGKTKYCDYDFKSATLTATTKWTEASISSWTWTTTSTTAGVPTGANYLTKGFGTYNVTYKDAFGCVSEKSTDFVIAPIARPATPAIRLVGNAVNCATNDAGVANTVSFDVTSPALAGTPTYQWYLGSSVVQNSTSNSLKNIASSGIVTLTQTDVATGCTSLPSTGVTIAFQANPSFTGASITKEAYTLTAKGFNPDGVNDYVWKVGGTLLGTSSTQKIVGTSAAEYSVAQYKSYTINGSTIKCLSATTKYSYVPDPDFSGVIVYPNPASTSLKIDVLSENWSGATTISVYDMVGRLMLTRSVANFPVNISDLGLSNGMYVLNLNSSNGNAFQTKLVINK